MTARISHGGVWCLVVKPTVRAHNTRACHFCLWPCTRFILSCAVNANPTKQSARWSNQNIGGYRDNCLTEDPYFLSLLRWCFVLLWVRPFGLSLRPLPCSPVTLPPGRSGLALLIVARLRNVAVHIFSALQHRYETLLN